PLAITWTNLSGPAQVTLGSPTSAVTTATFTVSGLYVFRLSASDTIDEMSDLMEVGVGMACAVKAPPGLAAWWPANSSTADSVNGRDAILQMDADYTYGKVGAAFQLNGVADFIKVPGNSNYDVGSSPEGFTIEFWEKDATNNFARSLLGWNGASNM